jgi:hypothetical protein
MKKIEDRMRDSEDAEELIRDQPNLLVAPSDRGSDRYTQWISGLEKPIARINMQISRRFFFACLNHLTVCSMQVLYLHFVFVIVI